MQSSSQGLGGDARDVHQVYDPGGLSTCEGLKGSEGRVGTALGRGCVPPSLLLAAAISVTSGSFCCREMCLSFSSELSAQTEPVRCGAVCGGRGPGRLLGDTGPCRAGGRGRRSTSVPLLEPQLWPW